MKAMVCEMCTSPELVMQNGLLVCQHCGTKYRVDDAQNLFAVSAASADRSEELQNLFVLARRARDTHNAVSAQKYYEQILLLAPFSWEASFYSVYYQSYNCKVSEIAMAAVRLIHAESTVIDLLLDEVTDPDACRLCFGEIAVRLQIISRMFYEGARTRYTQTGSRMSSPHHSEFVHAAHNAIRILYTFGDLVEKLCDHDLTPKAAVSCWEQGVELHRDLMSRMVYNTEHLQTADMYQRKIAQYRHTPSPHAYTDAPVPDTEAHAQKGKILTVILLVVVGLAALPAILTPGGFFFLVVVPVVVYLSVRAKKKKRT